MAEPGLASSSAAPQFTPCGRLGGGGGRVGRMRIQKQSCPVLKKNQVSFKAKKRTGNFKDKGPKWRKQHFQLHIWEPLAQRYWLIDLLRPRNLGEVSFPLSHSPAKTRAGPFVVKDARPAQTCFHVCMRAHAHARAHTRPPPRRQGGAQNLVRLPWSSSRSSMCHFYVLTSHCPQSPGCSPGAVMPSAQPCRD